jgi:phospholipase C
MPAQIKHLFVLMIENRSFDHLFGFMMAPGYKIEGLDPAALPFYQRPGRCAKLALPVSYLYIG